MQYEVVFMFCPTLLVTAHRLSFLYHSIINWFITIISKVKKWAHNCNKMMIITCIQIWNQLTRGLLGKALYYIIPLYMLLVVDCNFGTVALWVWSPFMPDDDEAFQQWDTIRLQVPWCFSAYSTHLFVNGAVTAEMSAASREKRLAKMDIEDKTTSVSNRWVVVLFRTHRKYNFGRPSIIFTVCWVSVWAS